MRGLEGVLARPMFALPWAIVRSLNSLFDVREATYLVKKLLRRHAPSMRRLVDTRPSHPRVQHMSTAPLLYQEG